MKAYIKSLFMVLLLIVATLPTYSIGVAAKNSNDDDDDKYDDDLYLIEQPESRETSPSKGFKAKEPQTFWLRAGESKVVETNIVLTYLGSSQKPSQILCMADAQLCPDGKTYVSRNPKLNCAFDACPLSGTKDTNAIQIASVSDALPEGAEKIYNLGREYNLEVMIIEDTKPATVTFKVNGEVTGQLPIGASAVLKDGTSLFVHDIALRYGGRDDFVKFTLGGQSDSSQPTYPVPAPVNPVQGDVCEQFQITYSYVAPSQGVVSMPELVGSAMPVPGESKNVKEMEVYPTQPALVVTKDDLDTVADVVKPTSVTKDIIGETAYNKEILEEDAVVAKPVPLDTARRDALAKRIATLAYVIGGEEYMSFSFREDKVAEAIVQILERKGVIISEKNGNWIKEAEAFIKQNNIDVEQFVNNLRLAQKYLSLAQIQTYNAVLYLQANNLDGAETEIKQAEENFAMFRKPMDYVANEINRWKPFQGQGKGKAISEQSETFCLVQGEVGYPIMLYDKKDNAVLVGYNVWKENGDKALPDYKVPAVDTVARSRTKEIISKEKESSKEGCLVEGNGAVPVGTRVNIDGVSQYCDPLTKKMLKQKIDGEVAENNYECLSNEARNGVCENSLSFLQKIWKSIIGIFGFE